MRCQQNRGVLDLSAKRLDRVGDLAVDTEDTVDAGGTGPHSHGARVGSPAHEESQSADQHGLAGAGLSGDDVESRAQFESGLGDDPEGGDTKFFNHDADPR